MSIYDAHLELSNAQGAITASVVSTNILNMGLTTVPEGDETPAGFLEVDVDTTGTGAGTVDIQIRDCDTVGGTYVAIASSGPKVGTTLVAGNKYKIPLPGKHREFIQAYYLVASTVGALKLTAHINTN